MCIHIYIRSVSYTMAKEHRATILRTNFRAAFSNHNNKYSLFLRFSSVCSYIFKIHNNSSFNTNTNTNTQMLTRFYIWIALAWLSNISIRLCLLFGKRLEKPMNKLYARATYKITSFSFSLWRSNGKNTQNAQFGEREKVLHIHKHAKEKSRTHTHKQKQREQ